MNLHTSTLHRYINVTLVVSLNDCQPKFHCGITKDRPRLKLPGFINPFCLKFYFTLYFLYELLQCANSSCFFVQRWHYNLNSLFPSWTITTCILGWQINALTRTGPRPETRPEGGGAGRGRAGQGGADILHFKVFQVKSIGI